MDNSTNNLPSVVAYNLIK